MKRAARVPRQVAPLPLRAVYTIRELATASSLNRRQLCRLFKRIGIRMIVHGKRVLVPLSELEANAWPFWESIQTAEMLRHRSGGWREASFDSVVAIDQKHPPTTLG